MISWWKVNPVVFQSPKLVKFLEVENERLRAELQRLQAQNSQLVDKIIALSNERAFVLAGNGEAKKTSPIYDIAFNEWGEEVQGEQL